MNHKHLQGDLSKKRRTGNKNLSMWNAAIEEAKSRIAELKRSIKTFESLRDGGMQFPEPKKRRARKSQNEAKA
ncbi:MAG TPA: hypothetical protein VF791_06730 [Pyrinomonadaceae bacterium]